MPWADTNGVRTYYESHGEGPALVFCHANGGNHLSWWQQVPYFRDRYRCITYDMRGSGATPDVPNGPANAGWADDLRVLLDTIGVEKASFVCQSGGGQACLRFAVAYPSRALAMVLVNSGSGVTSPILADFLTKYRAEHPEIRQEDHQAPAWLREKRPDLVYLMDAIGRLNPPLGDVQPGLPEAKYIATPEKLAKMTMPTLVLRGLQDIIAPTEVFKWVSTLIPGTKYVELAESGPQPYFDDAPNFNRIVGDFLASVGADQ